MTDAMSDVDVAVVGAGAAGVAAARRLLALGRTVQVLEARERAGGRAHTVMTAAGFPIDLSCGWLHSADRNPWAAIARELGFAIDETQPGWGERLVRAGFSRADQEDWFRSREAFYARLEDGAEGPDRPAREFLEPGNRWNGLLDAISTWANGAELDRISARDNRRYEDTGVNWRVLEGYGALVERHAAGLPIKFLAPVGLVDRSGQAVKLEAASGALRARAAILTVPPSVVAAGNIRFVPELPAEKRAAAEGLPLGVDNKLYFSLAGEWPEIGANWHIAGSVERTATASYQLKPHGRLLVEMFSGGKLALELERAGAAAMADFGRAELAKFFGAKFARALKPLAASAWGDDPFARGSYSYALPGHADDRAGWAAPVDGRLFFAGEAASPDFFSTTHGAYLSGIAAADAADAALGR